MVALRKRLHQALGYSLHSTLPGWSERVEASEIDQAHAMDRILLVDPRTLRAAQVPIGAILRFGLQKTALQPMTRAERTP